MFKIFLFFGNLYMPSGSWTHDLTFYPLSVELEPIWKDALIVKIELGLKVDKFGWAMIDASWVGCKNNDFEDQWQLE
jgi:hypothetical protein